ncbi:unnamed protein product [Victoria cruziana]
MMMGQQLQVSWRNMMMTVLCLQILVTAVMADIGTTASYTAPYIPTQCWGYDQSRFPANNMFVSAGEMLWDNGAACGRRYKVRCIGGRDRPCVGGFVDVTVVDACGTFPCPSTFLFSTDAFQQISRNPDTTVSVEFWQI